MFEYLIITTHREHLEGLMNTLGRQGWELVTSQGDKLYFKRLLTRE